MTTHVRKNQTTVVAGQDLTADSALYKALAVGGTIAATNAAALGLLMTKGKTGEHVGVAYEGEVKAWAGAALAAGARLMVTTSGWLITATDSRSTVGRALEAANSGDLARVLVDFVSAN